MHNNYWRTEKINIRAFDESDIERMIQNRNNRDSKLEWLHDVIRLPRAPEKLRADHAEAIAEANSDDKCLLAIEDLNGNYAGELNVWLTKRPELYFVYGIYIEDRFRGRGFAKEALTILLDYYFNEKGFRKAEAHVYGYNDGSRVFHEKFGFVLEGTLRGRIFSRGVANSIHIYGLLAQEFNERHSHNDWRRV